MLHKVSANKKSFHTVEFHSGLNIIVADSETESGTRDTRNSVGKTTLLKIINFCLGSSLPASFKNEELIDWEFYLTLTLLEEKFTVARSIADNTKIYLEGPISILPAKFSQEEDGRNYLSLEDWKHLLGNVLFSSNLDSRLSFRSLVSYFIRVSKEAYLQPDKHFTAQPKSTAQLLLSFLLGLNPTYASQWYDLNEQARSINVLMQAQKANVGPSVGDLRTRKIQIEESIQANRNNASSIKVHEHYEHIQRENERITRDLHKFTNENLVFKKRRDSYLSSVENEEYPDDSLIEQIYNEAKITFPERVKATLDEAKNFHQEIVENRKKLISTEIADLDRKIKRTQDSIDRIIGQRNKNLGILEEKSSLAEMIRIQEEQSLLLNELRDIEKKIEELTNAEKIKNEISDKKTKLKGKAEVYHEEHNKFWATAVKRFNANTKALYGDKISGNLIINITKDGYSFDISIPKSDGDGVGKMTIFAFDLMLLELQKLQGRSIDFLIHDSILYDGVDTRQVALALELVKKICEKNNLQYICCFNSDAVPDKEFSKDFNFKDFVVLKLSDKDIGGSLLGVDF